MITIKEEHELYLEMARLMGNRANSIYGDIGKYIYFSHCNSSHGPRIKFYGGTKDTADTTNAPTMKFDKDGNSEVELADWMNKKNCPNAYDKKYTAKVANFIKMTYPILLLVWFNKIIDAEALLYFQGIISFRELLEGAEIESLDINSIETMDELDDFCKKYNLYNF